jgi:hypothetical protein
MIISTSLAIMTLLYIIPQQQEQHAIADSSTKITTINTDQNNLKLSVNNNNSNNSNFLSYQNKAFGIAIQYPSTWQKVDEESHEKGKGEAGKEHQIGGNSMLSLPDQASADEPMVEFVSPIEDSSDKYQETLSTSVHKLHTRNIGEDFGLFDKPTSQKILLHGFVLSHITSLIAKLPSFDLNKSESGNGEITLADGSLGHKIVYTYKGKGQISNNAYLKVMEVLTVSRDRGYIIRYSSEPLKYYSYLPTIQRMISSFRVTTK